MMMTWDHCRFNTMPQMVVPAKVVCLAKEQIQKHGKHHMCNFMMQNSQILLL